MENKKIISWNVNGLRACAKKGFFEFLLKEKPDIMGIQEIKTGIDQVKEDIYHPDGYKAVLFPAQRAGYSGVGFYIKKGFDFDIKKGIDVKEFDVEGRVISIHTDKFIFITAYFPNSQAERNRLTYKLEFCDAIKEYTDKLSKNGTPVLLSGDYNIAHTELDLTNPKDNTDSPGFYPEERTWMEKFLAKGYIDTFRLFEKSGGHYTWWSYRTNARSRNVGWRIDYHCVNEHLVDKVQKSYHNTDVLGSDHCPVTIILK